MLTINVQHDSHNHHDCADHRLGDLAQGDIASGHTKGADKAEASTFPSNRGADSDCRTLQSSFGFLQHSGFDDFEFARSAQPGRSESRHKQRGNT